MNERKKIKLCVNPSNKSNQILEDYENLEHTEQLLLDEFRQGIQINPSISSSLSVILNNNKISWKAKSITITIINNENHFLNVSINKENLLQKLSKGEIECIKSGIKELQNAGLLCKKIHRNTKGKNYITGSTWHINIIHKEDI